MTSITINTDDLLSVQAAAKRLGRPRLAVYRMIKRKAITGIELGGTTFVLTKEIEEILKGGVKTEDNEPVQKE
jgi:excisionase family DNA binding protein